MSRSTRRARPAIEPLESRHLLATLLWSDEFNGAVGTAPDSTRWNYDLGAGGWGNAELQTYTNSLQNSAIAADPAATDGKVLAITAIKQTDGSYTSARLQTRGKMSIAYGRWEARAKLPFGQGIWPAIWMLGDDIGSAGWPGCGEIDIMENIGREPSSVHGTLHGPGYSAGDSLGSTYTLPNGARFSDAYHTFAISWSPTAIRFYVDGNLYRTRTRSDVPAGSNWVFDHPFFAIVNLAVGGNWPGYPDATTTFPQKFLIDYVRVYSELPDDWSDTDIGSPAMAGGAGIDLPTATWGLTAGGTDIWNTSDQFNFASKPISADGELIARLGTMTDTDTWAKAGLMFRASTAANAPFVTLVQMPNGELAFQWRTTAGAAADWSGSRVGGTAPNKWIRLTRTGNTFAAFYATTATTPTASNWIQIGIPQTITMPSVIRGGLAITSHNTAALCTATFTNVSLTDSLPAVQGFTINSGAAQRSMVNQLNLTFAEPVTLGSGVALKLSTGAPVPGVNVLSNSPDGKSYTLTFSGPSATSGSLPDGIYSLILTASAITDSTGNPLPADRTFTFHRLFGDTDGNKIVNAIDYARLRTTFARSVGDPLFNPGLDYDSNNLINALDLAQFRRRFGMVYSY